MAVKIRLSRYGAKKAPFYRIVAADSRDPRDGRFLELLGVYDPRREPPEVRLNEARVEHWIGVGAKASDTVRQLIKQAKRASA